MPYRWSGEGQLLEVAAGEDPLACLQLQADAADALLLGGQQGTASGPQLVLTPEVRSQLAMLAPWLHSKEPFLLVRGAGVERVWDQAVVWVWLVSKLTFRR
jgi:hypothetical protein